MILTVIVFSLAPAEPHMLHKVILQKLQKNYSVSFIAVLQLNIHFAVFLLGVLPFRCWRKLSTFSHAQIFLEVCILLLNLGTSVTRL